MLKYLVQTSEQLIVLAIFLGLIFAFVQNSYEKKERRLYYILAGVGIFASAFISYMKNTTNLINTILFNFRYFAIFFTSLVIFFVVRIPKLNKKLGKYVSYIEVITLGLMSIASTLYYLPEVLAYPYTFILNGQEVLSTDYLYRFIGFITGFVLDLLVFFAVRHVASALDESHRKTGLYISMFIVSLRFLASLLSGLLSRRIIVNNHTLFLISKFTTNHKELFVYAMMILAIWMVFTLFKRGLHVNEPYRNPAEHRKIIAKWRKRRRWCAAATACLLMVVLNMTVIKAYDNREVQLSPIEDAAQITDEDVCVSFEQVSDGHLHRFAYDYNGKEIRFIIIKKPNSSSYGVGLDACDICGETGYYEKDGQVVCKLCDVVMNINTIGFKGGCNPKVIPYSVSDGYIKVSIEGLIEHESDFK
ncbi:MAG: DUF2318 domain-containing protein [Faecalicoccus sp.]|nr:DUF2318 domain-containing protein [Faecalicoccus sp.]